MVEQFLSYALNHQLQNYVRTANEITRRTQTSPLYTYIGIHYLDDRILSFKVYYNLFNKLAEEDARKLFADFDAIKDTYNTYESSTVFNAKNMGITFRFKLDKEGATSRSFYVRLPQLEVPVRSLKNLPERETNELGNMFACETEGEQLYLKNYYVFQQAENKKAILKHFGEETTPLDWVHAIEYVEFEGKAKMLMAILDKNNVAKYLKAQQNPALNELVEYLHKEVGLIPLSPGGYLNSKVKSIYFLDEGETLYVRDSLTMLRLAEKLFHV